jgi:hypothetical protein
MFFYATDNTVQKEESKCSHNRLRIVEEHEEAC